MIKKDLDRAHLLHQDMVISDAELDLKKSEFIRSERSMETLLLQKLESARRVDEIQTRIVEIQSDRRYELRIALDQFINAVQLGASEIDMWTQTYTILAPKSGEFYMQNSLSQSTFQKQSTILATVLPHHRSTVYATARLPSSRVGLLSEGLKAWVRLDAFPYLDYGVIEGSVLGVSPVPQVDAEGLITYEVTLILPEKPLTSYGRVIKYMPRSTGTVRVVTENRRLLLRLVDSLYNLLNSK